MVVVLPLLGLVAGVLTTLAGQGGGLFLLLASSFLFGPHAALAMTAPALLCGNAHRALLFRRAIDRPIAVRMTLGAVPGALAGGLLAGVTPAWTLKAVLIGLTALALAKALFKVRREVPRGALTPAGFVLGGLTGTAGGAGFLVAPLLLASGLTGRAFVATTSTIAVAMHAGRVVAYGATGLLTRETLLGTVVLTLAIFAGNALGERVRRRLPEAATTGLEYGVLAVCSALSIVGIA
jgi:hypothetical protein